MGEIYDVQIHAVITTHGKASQHLLSQEQFLSMLAHTPTVRHKLEVGERRDSRCAMFTWLYMPW